MLISTRFKCGKKSNVPKFASMMVMQEKARLEVSFVTPTYAYKKTAVTTAEMLIIHLRPRRVFTETAASKGPTSPTADSMQ